MTGRQRTPAFPLFLITMLLLDESESFAGGWHNSPEPCWGCGSDSSLGRKLERNEGKIWRCVNVVCAMNALRTGRKRHTESFTRTLKFIWWDNEQCYLAAEALPFCILFQERQHEEKPEKRCTEGENELEAARWWEMGNFDVIKPAKNWLECAAVVDWGSLSYLTLLCNTGSIPP